MTIATPAPKPETIISSNPNSKLMTSLKVTVKKEFPKMKTMKAMKSVPILMWKCPSSFEKLTI